MDKSPHDSVVLDIDRHVLYLRFVMNGLPPVYQDQEINHLTLAYFAISALDLLNALDELDKHEVLNWVLSFRELPTNESDLKNGEFYGFCGSRSSLFPHADSTVHGGRSHLASTYSALAILKILGYSLSCVGPESVLTSMRNLQQQDGSFVSSRVATEKDLRFVFCAAAICYMLNDWRGMDKGKTKQYILSCQSYDGGFGLVPGSESHGGATYCAIASLRLMGNKVSVDSSPSFLREIDVHLLMNWLLQRQAADGGFQGRINKPSDTCYAFWVGGVLKILGADHLFNKAALEKFLLSCQSQYGGFSKFHGQTEDVYHSYYVLTAFSLFGEFGLKSICAEVGISYNALCGG